jgi:hypothetical protein
VQFNQSGFNRGNVLDAPASLPHKEGIAVADRGKQLEPTRLNASKACSSANLM